MKTRSIRIPLALFLLAWIMVATLLQAVATDNATTLTLVRETVNYLFEIPATHAVECLWFTWTVKTDPSYAGQVAVLQFSHNGEEWRDLANAIVESNGMASHNQPVDSSWAVSGRNYLRVVIGEEASNTVILTVNVGVGYWVIGGVIAFIGVIVALWYITTKNGIETPQTLEKLQSFVCAYVQGREKALFLTLGLLIRVLLAPWTEQRFDNYVNRLWCSLVYGYDLYPFEPHMPFAYPLILRYSFPPIWLYIILSLFPMWSMMSGYNFPEEPASLWKHGIDVNNIFESYRSFVPQALPLLDFFFKLPNVMADVGIGYLLYKLAKNSKHEKAVLFIWLFNPYTIQISAVWGLFDPLCTFLAFYSVYLLSKRKFFLSAMFLSLGVATKMYPLFFLVPILIYVYKEQGLGKSFKYFIISFFVGLLIFGSFLLFLGGLEFVYRLFIFKASPDWYGRNHISGMTWMYLFTLFRWEGNLPIFPLIFTPVYLGFNYIFWRGKNDFDSLVACLVSVLLVVYLSYTVVHPQYVFWVLPLMLYLAIKGKFSKRLYTIFSAIPLVFMYARYNPLQFLSPVIIWEEWNYPPWSDIIHQLWPIIFNVVTLGFLVGLFCFVSLFSLVSLKRHIKGGLSKR
jgi:Gpi18-like mannosyltransferase